MKINSAANKSKRNHWHTARLCPGLGLVTSGCSLLVPGLAAACCQRPAGTGAAPGSAPGLGHAQPSGAPLPGSSLGSSAVFGGVRGGGAKGVRRIPPGGKGSGGSQGSSSPAVTPRGRHRHRPRAPARRGHDGGSVCSAGGRGLSRLLAQGSACPYPPSGDEPSPPSPSGYTHTHTRTYLYINVYI